MDAKVFDNVTRSLGGARNRRDLLKGAAGAAAAAMGIALAGRSARAVTCNFDLQCQGKCGLDRATCCNGVCVGACPPRFNLNSGCVCVKRFRDGRVVTRQPNAC